MGYLLYNKMVYEIDYDITGWEGIKPFKSSEIMG